MHIAYKILIALFVLADVAIGSFYGGMRYATPVPLEKGIEEFGDITTLSGTVKARSSDSITVQLGPDAYKTFVITPQTKIHMNYTDEFTFKHIRIGAGVGITAEGDTATNITATQRLSDGQKSATTTQ